MLPIASLYEEAEALGRPLNQNPQTSSDGSVSNSEVIAMKHYTKALHELQQGLKSKTMSPTVILIACMLFTCTEALRGQNDAAMVHIGNGLNIISNLKELHENHSVIVRRSLVLPEHSQFTEPLAGAFSRLRILALSIKEQNLPGNISIEPLKTPRRLPIRIHIQQFR